MRCLRLLTSTAAVWRLVSTRSCSCITSLQACVRSSQPSHASTWRRGTLKTLSWPTPCCIRATSPRAGWVDRRPLGCWPTLRTSARPCWRVMAIAMCCTDCCSQRVPSSAASQTSRTVSRPSVWRLNPCPPCQSQSLRRCSRREALTCVTVTSRLSRPIDLVDRLSQRASLGPAALRPHSYASDSHSVALVERLRLSMSIEAPSIPQHRPTAEYSCTRIEAHSSVVRTRASRCSTRRRRAESRALVQRRCKCRSGCVPGHCPCARAGHPCTDRCHCWPELTAVVRGYNKNFAHLWCRNHIYRGGPLVYSPSGLVIADLHYRSLRRQTEVSRERLLRSELNRARRVARSHRYHAVDRDRPPLPLCSMADPPADRLVGVEPNPGPRACMRCASVESDRRLQ